MEKIKIYTDTVGVVYFHQNDESTLAEFEITTSDIPTIPAREIDGNLYDGYLIYNGKKFTFGYKLNHNKCYGAVNDQRGKLSSMDYLHNKQIRGDKMTEYGDWEDDANKCTAEINRIEKLINDETK